MVVDIINKTLDTHRYRKILILTSATEPSCILILMVTFMKLGPIIFEKRSIN
jgi:hypothetical protein